MNVSVTGSGVAVSVTGGGPIQASVAGQQSISASAPNAAPQAATVTQASPVSAIVTGGMGPPGTPNRLVDLTDTDVASAVSGDVLRYDGTKWRGRAETQLVDGGNW